MKFPEDRGLGRTTACALRAITAAIDTPNLWIRLRDHHGGSDSSIWHCTQDLVDRMGLLGFEFNRPKNSIRFDLGPMRKRLEETFRCVT